MKLIIQYARVGHIDGVIARWMQRYKCERCGVTSSWKKQGTEMNDEVDEHRRHGVVVVSESYMLASHASDLT